MKHLKKRHEPSQIIEMITVIHYKKDMTTFPPYRNVMNEPYILSKGSYYICITYVGIAEWFSNCSLCLNNTCRHRANNDTSAASTLHCVPSCTSAVQTHYLQQKKIQLFPYSEIVLLSVESHMQTTN